MNRRSFLSCLGGAPFVGLLKTKKSDYEPKMIQYGSREASLKDVRLAWLKHTGLHDRMVDPRTMIQMVARAYKRNNPKIWALTNGKGLVPVGMGWAMSNMDELTYEWCDINPDDWEIRVALMGGFRRA